MIIDMTACLKNLFIDVDPALVGLSLFYAIRLTGLLQFTIRTSADVENLVRKSLVTCLIV